MAYILIINSKLPNENGLEFLDITNEPHNVTFWTKASNQLKNVLITLPYTYDGNRDGAVNYLTTPSMFNYK